MAEDSNGNHKNRHELKKHKYKKHKLLQEKEVLECLLRSKQDTLEKIDNKFSRFFNENRQLRETMFILQQEKDEAEKRLNELGETETDLKRLHLSDLKGELLAKRWDALYSREWCAAFEELCEQQRDKKCKKEPEKTLLEVTGWCYDKCSDLAKDQMEKVKSLLVGVACIMNLQPLQQNENSIPDDVSTTFRTLLKYVHHMMDDMEVIENIKKKCLEEYKSYHTGELKNMVRFASKCCEICWQMRTLDPPMQLQFRDLETKQCDKTKFNKYNVIGDHIESVVWPVLLLHENGPVISKGLVRTYSDPFKHDNDDELLSKHFCKVDEADDADGTSGIKRGDNIYITMRCPTDERPFTVHHDFESSMKLRPLSKSDGMTKSIEGNSEVVLESNIALEKRLQTPENNSPFQDDINTRPKNRHHHGKTKEQVSPKDGTFVSYLYTNSS